MLEMGEMCLSPLGLAAPPLSSASRMASLMMGMQFPANAFPETLTALFGNIAAIGMPDDGRLDLAEASAGCARLFWQPT